jgi:aprataxin
MTDTIAFEKQYNFVFKRPPKFHDDFRNAFLVKVPALKDDDEELFYADDKVVVIYDMFPKAMYHLLVLPKDVSLIDASVLTSEHVPILEHMKFVGEQLIKHLKATQKEKTEFKMGFHAIPSLKLLHLHVISQDFVSKSLKKTEHWNSFTTKFFVPPEDVIQALKDNGKFEIDKEEYKKIKETNIVKCHRTGQAFNNMGALKQHLLKLYKKDQLI